MPRDESPVVSPRTGLALVESATVPAALVDSDGDIVHWNAPFEALTGYRRETPPPAWDTFVLPETPEVGRQQAELALATLTVFSGDLMCRRAGGSPIWCDVTLVPALRTGSGDERERQVMMALFRESTARRVAETALSGPEIADRFVLDRIQSGIVVHDAGSRILYANNKASELLGITYDRLLGRASADPAWEFVDQDGRALTIDDFPVSRVIATGEPVQRMVVGARRPDGLLSWGLCHAFPVRDAEGAISEIVVSFTDVSSLMEAKRELARNEERLQLVFSATNDALWDLDLVTGEGWCSARYWEMFGYAGRDTRVSGDDLSSLIHPDDLPVSFERMRKFFASGARTYEQELRMRHRAGHDVHVLVRGIILRDERGAAVRVAGTTTDITARRAMEHRLRQSQKLESVGHLAGGVAHDFNNLLAIISGNLELLEDSGFDAQETPALIREARNAAMRGAGLTRRLLAFSRQQPIRLEVVQAASVLTNAVEMVRRLLPESVEVALSCPDDLPLIHADAGLLENAILNLAINARDAMNARGVLSISASTVHLAEPEGVLSELESGDYLRVNVTDTGCGMSKEVLEQAIEPFFTTKDVGQGTGLGLSMVYGFVRQCGGTLHIRSTEGAGTTVSLYFPAPAQQGESPHVPATPITRHSRPRRDEVILVVEDDPSVRALCLRELTALGFRTLEAKDGPTALEVFESAPRVDLLLTDIVMPGGMNGNEVAASLVARQPALQVIFMSGYHADILKDLIRDAGTHLLSKPFSISELSILLDELLPRAQPDR